MELKARDLYEDAPSIVLELRILQGKSDNHSINPTYNFSARVKLSWHYEDNLFLYSSFQNILENKY